MPRDLKTPLQEKVSHIPKSIEKTALTIGASDKYLDIDDIEIISTFWTSDVVLTVEEIPLIDILYSPQHKAIVKRQRKRKNIDQT